VARNSYELFASFHAHDCDPSNHQVTYTGTCLAKAIWNGAVIVESDRTVMMEGNVYFPSDSVKPEYLRPSETHTVCPWKGTASYRHAEVDGKRNLDAAWHYPEPSAAAQEIKEHVACWKGVRIEK
jgi:uncharacterized protein (DUF427 family)